jgi:hypothetical protein
LLDNFALQLKLWQRPFQFSQDLTDSRMMAASQTCGQDFEMTTSRLSQHERPAVIYPMDDQISSSDVNPTPKGHAQVDGSNQIPADFFEINRGYAW